MQRNVVLASAALWLGLGCGVDGGEPATQQSQAITDGKEDTGHPEVGRLLIDAQSGTAKDTCTAVLIGKKLALTAAHCCKPADNNLFQLNKKIKQVDKVVPNGSWNPSTSKYKNDICVVLLSDPVSLSTFPPYGSVAPAAGMAVTLVGMGRTTENVKDSGTKRMASNKVESVATGYFTIVGSGGGVGNICTGDSGGPVYTSSGGKDVVVGVISADQSPYCVGTKSFHVSVKSFTSWIAAQLPSTGDTVAPQVSIISPADGATVATSVMLSAGATDNVGVVSVEALVDGTSAGVMPSLPYQLPLTLTAGSHSIEVVAKDAAGNSGSDKVTVTAVDGPLPDGGFVTEGGVIPSGDGPAGDGAIGPRGADGCAFAGDRTRFAPWAAVVLLPWLLLVFVSRQRFRC